MDGRDVGGSGMSSARHADDGLLIIEIPWSRGAQVARPIND